MKNGIIIALALVVVIAFGYIFFGKSEMKDITMNPNPNEQVACTLDVKECPDGSFVGRIAPNCEFAICPTRASPVKTTADVKQKVSFDYPDNFYLNNRLAEYIHPVEWPPQIAVSSGAFTCSKNGNVLDTNGKTELIKISGKDYCVTTQSEGAAGSVYTTYSFKSIVEKKFITISFIVRLPQCANFDEPKMSECENEKKQFSINDLVDKIFKSVKFI